MSKQKRQFSVGDIAVLDGVTVVAISSDDCSNCALHVLPVLPVLRAGSESGQMCRFCNCIDGAYRWKIKQDCE